MITKNYNRIAILGGPGSGKTTLSNILSKKYELPVHHIDGIHYLNNWIPRNIEERDNIILKIISEEKWVLDGNYSTTLNERLLRADLIVYLDFSTTNQFLGVIKRGIKLFKKERNEIPGCKNKIDKAFIKKIYNYNKKHRKILYEKLALCNNKDIYIFKNRYAVNKWLNKKVK